MELDADIVCVQEMDWAQYEDYWVPRLCGEVKSESMQPGVYTKPVDPDNGFNYSACFYPKSRFRSMSEKAKRSPNGGVDGCATFWRRNALQPVGQPFTIEFAQLALSRNDFQKNDTMFARFCSKDNIALAIVLERIETKQRVLVTNVHIHWDPLQTDVKLVQSYMLMEQLEKFTKKFLREQSANSSQKHLPTIICGDFNSLPGSLVYQFLSNPGGVREVGIHEDLKECFTPAIDSKSEAVSETTAETPSSSGISAESGANSSASSSTSNLVGSVDSPMPAADPSNSEDDPSVLKRWPNWKSSGYGDIAKTEVLKHYLSGSLMSAYGGIESVPIEVFLFLILCSYNIDDVFREKISTSPRRMFFRLPPTALANRLPILSRVFRSQITQLDSPVSLTTFGSRLMILKWMEPLVVIFSEPILAKMLFAGFEKVS